MSKRWSWLAAGMFVVVSSLAHAKGREDEGSEAGLDLTLRTKAAAMPVKTADGSAMETPASHMYLMDYDTGAVLASKAGDEKMYPSSMTKIMTLYLVFDRLKQGTLALNNQFTVSQSTWVKWNNRGSSMFLPINSQVSLEDLIRGIAIQSGNDACAVMAEGLAGSEEAFAKQMNDTAKQLGMINSHFTDSSGWPDPAHVTTAHDLAILGSALIRNFPQYYHYLSEREFTFHKIRQFNRNLLLNNPSLKVDGIKTGHTDAAGYGITLSAVDPATGRREILVVNGLDSTEARAQEGERLLKWGFMNFSNTVLFKPGQEITKAKVWMGGAREIPLTVANNVLATLPKTGKVSHRITVSYKSPLIAPVKMGQEVGKLSITGADGTCMTYPLVAGADDAKLSFFGRIPRALGL